MPDPLPPITVSVVAAPRPTVVLSIPSIGPDARSLAYRVVALAIDLRDPENFPDSARFDVEQGRFSTSVLCAVGGSPGSSTAAIHAVRAALVAAANREARTVWETARLGAPRYDVRVV